MQTFSLPVRKLFTRRKTAHANFINKEIMKIRQTLSFELGMVIGFFLGVAIVTALK